MERVFIKISFVFLIIHLSFFVLSGDIYAIDVNRQIEKIQKAYKDIKSLSGKFTQVSYIKDLDRVDNYKGRFFIKRPMKLKWEYEGKNPQEIYINNGEIIIYQKKEKQVIKGIFNKENYGQAPVVLLNGFGNITDEFNVTGKDNRLVLKPKKPLGSISHIELILTDEDFPILSFVIYDNHSNKTTISLKDIEVNEDLDDNIFKPVFPKDVSVFSQ
jgi:outer membrane lipoprotein carrier protein